MDDEEIKKIAEGMYKGEIFTNFHLIHGEDLKLAFPVLALLNKDQIEQLKEPGMIYEHLSEAGPLSVNSYPIFFSFHYLNKEDAGKVLEKYEQIKDAVMKI